MVRSRIPLLKEFPRFAAVYVMTLVVNLVVLPVVLAVLPVTIYVAQAAFAVVVVIGSYLGHKYYSFRDEVHEDSGNASAFEPTARSED